jgi:DNA repair protein RAD16
MVCFYYSPDCVCQLPLILIDSFTVHLSLPVKAEDAPSSTRSTTKRTRSSRTFVPNSKTEDEIIETKQPEQISLPIRRVLKAVAIPNRPSRMASRKSGVEALHRGGSDGSASLDASDYETPRTSVSTTPALSTRRGRSTGKSNLSTAVKPGSSIRNKRLRDIIQDTEDEEDDLGFDAELAMQLQMEEDQQDRKRKNVIDDDTDEDDMPLAKRARPYSGKGKGKAKIEEIDSDEDMDLDFTPIAKPTYKGKGKGKAVRKSSI